MAAQTEIVRAAMLIGSLPHESILMLYTTAQADRGTNDWHIAVLLTFENRIESTTCFERGQADCAVEQGDAALLIDTWYRNFFVHNFEAEAEENFQQDRSHAFINEMRYQ